MKFIEGETYQTDDRQVWIVVARTSKTVTVTADREDGPRLRQPVRVYSGVEYCRLGRYADSPVLRSNSTP